MQTPVGGPPKPFLVAARTRTVEAWSVHRLPFEPSGWLLDFRSALRAALRSLQPSPTLSAVYSSVAPDFCDVENVLFYNVGTSSFASVGTTRVSFERTWAQPTAPPRPLDGSAAHHHLYRADASPSVWQHWVAGRPLASWSDVHLTAPATASGVWWSMRNTGTTTLVSTARRRYLGLSLQIGHSSTGRVSLFNLMKPLLDGVVSAFHVHDGLHGPEIAARLAPHLKAVPAAVQASLNEDRWGVLGPRTLVRPYRDGVMWNPADERLVAVSVETVAAPASVLSGELFETEPVQ